MLPTMTAGALPPSRSARARLAAAAAAAVVVATAVVAGLPGAAAQGPELVTGLVRGRGFPVVGAPNERIIGGRNVTLNDAEYGGGFFTKLLRQIDQNTYQFYCGGALIGRDKILTAAHCYDQTSISSAVGDVVRIGGLTLGEGIQRPIIAAVAHPQYRNTGSNLEYDFAILTIGDPPTPAQYREAGIEAAFVNAFSRFPRPGRTLTLVGHGDTRSTESSVPFELGLARVPINAWDQCNSWWVKNGLRGTVRPEGSDVYQVCGGLGFQQSSCFGDSGSPLFERASINGRFFNRIFGVVSYGFPDVANRANRCGLLNPDYYAKVSAARSFIRANT